MAESSPGTSNLFKEMGGMTGRTAYSSRLWLDSSVKRLPIAYAYHDSFGLSDVFQRVARFWSDNSCLTFKRVPQSRCTKKQSTPAILLKTLAGYAEHFGIDKSESCTTMSVDFGVYTWTQELMMNILGMVSYIYRNDSAQYISISEENLGVYLENNPSLKSILPSYHRCHGKTQVLPTPFDYLSKVMPYSLDQGSLLETRPVFVTRETRYQYLLDYQEFSSSDPTFYDVLVINTLYKCPAEWASACSGAVPSCRNHGYLMKSCKCRCPPGFSGERCETKTGPMFPLQPGASEVTVSTDTTTDFSTLNLKGVKLPSGDEQFRFYIFIIVNLKPKNTTDLASVSFQLPFKPFQEKFGDRSSYLISWIRTTDCNIGLRLLWGSGDRLAGECLTSLITNEPASEVRVFRARRPGMGMTLINNLGRSFGMPGLSVVTSQFLMTTQFRSPATGFRVIEKSGAKPAPAAAMKSAIGGAGLLPFVVPLLSLLMLICMCRLLCRLRRRDKRMDPAEQPEEEDDSESESEASSDD